MIIHVESHERAAHKTLVDSYLRLRKRVFHDELGWNVSVFGPIERDPLDDLPCTYALSIDADGRLNAGIRLIPTTQTTLLELAFDGLIPDEYNFRSPTIWELSRFCVSRQSRTGHLSAGLHRATLELTIANFDYARRNGITHYLMVTEDRMLRLLQQFGVPVDMLGSRMIDGCEVVCGLIPVNSEAAEIADRMRPFIARMDAGPVFQAGETALR